MVDRVLEGRAAKPRELTLEELEEFYDWRHSLPTPRNFRVSVGRLAPVELRTMDAPLTHANGEPNMEHPIQADLDTLPENPPITIGIDALPEPISIGLPHQDSGLPVNALAGMIGCVMGGLGPEDPDERLLEVPKLFEGELPTLEAIEAAYRYDLPEDRVAELVAHWKALFEAIERARARQRRVAARVPLILCRQRYYDQLEEGEVPGGDVVVKVAQPGIDGVFKHVAKFL